jgi:hypothetical protein
LEALNKPGDPRVLLASLNHFKIYLLSQFNFEVKNQARLVSFFPCFVGGGGIKGSGVDY